MCVCAAFCRTAIIGRARGHPTLCGVECAESFSSLFAEQKVNLLCTASTKDTHTVIVLGHAATDGHSN